MGKVADQGRRNCPLCLAFNKQESSDSSKDCNGCPVKLHTKRKYCEDTPYTAWERIVKKFPNYVPYNGYDYKIPENDVTTKEARNIAFEELDFLKMIRDNVKNK